MPVYKYKTFEGFDYEDAWWTGDTWDQNDWFSSDVWDSANDYTYDSYAVKGKKGEKEKPDIKFRISALGIQPITNRLFAISGMEHMLFVFDMNGKIEYLGKLDHKLFTQPEGITFMKNGDMLISNEGRNDFATILRFNFKK